MSKQGEKNYDIIICGERVRLEGLVGDPDCHVVTWKENAYFDFQGANYDKYLNANPENAGKKGVYNRKTAKGAPIKNIKDLDAVKASVKLLLLHADLTRDSWTCFEMLAYRGCSTHFMINWDGTIFQGMDVAYAAIHAKQANSTSVGIDMNNLMWNQRKGSIGFRKHTGSEWSEHHSNNGYKPNSANWERTPYEQLGDDDKKRFNRRKYPERGGIMRLDNGARVRAYGYTDAQFRALAELLKVLTDKLEVPREVPLGPDGKVLTSMIDLAEFSGILGHMHTDPSRWDPGPGLDWARLQAMLNNEGNSFPVLFRDKENIARLMDPVKVEARLTEYFRLNEEGLEKEGASVPEGGWFPMGPNQTWHGGVLLQNRPGADVRCMFDGTVVAARMSKPNTRLGSNNFLCVRHTVSIPRRNKTKKGELVFWSLYMHLDYMDIENMSADERPEWAKNMLKLGQEDRADEEDAMGSARPNEEADDDDDDDDDEFVEQYEDDEFLTKPTRIGKNYGDLKKGWVATFDWEENPIKITAGTVLGKVGEFGQPDEWLHQVRIELFADDRWKRAVDMAVHSRYFTEVRQKNQDGAPPSLFVHHRGLLSLYGADSSRRAKRPKSLVKGRILDPGDIADVYTSDDLASRAKKARLRRLVTHHVSEWSDQVDWIQALSEGDDWKKKSKDFKVLLKKSGMFKAALGTVLPHIWLNEDVAQAIGIDFGAAKKWTGQLWHFHPLHFLWWLTYRSSRRVQKFSRKLTSKEIKALRKQEEEAHETEASQGFTDSVNRDREFDDHFEPVDLSSSADINLDEVLEDFFEDMEAMPTEWRDVRMDE